MPSRASSETNSSADCSASFSASRSKSARIDAVVSAFDVASPCGEPLVISSVSFAPPLFYPGNPKFDVIRQKVIDTIKTSEAKDAASAAKATAKATSTATTKATASATKTPSSDNGTPIPTIDDLGVVCSAG